MATASPMCSWCPRFSRRRSPQWANGHDPLTTHGEKAAAYMADGYARVLAPAGRVHGPDRGRREPGGRFQGRASGLARPCWHCPAARRQHALQHAYQELVDDYSMFGQVTKFSARVETVERLPACCARRFVRPPAAGRARSTSKSRANKASLQTIRPRCDGGRGALRADACVPASGRRQPTSRPHSRHWSAPSDRRWSPAAAYQSPAPTEFVALAERLSIPFVTSLNGKSGIHRPPSARRRCRRDLLALVREPSCCSSPTWSSSSAATPAGS